jgi:hypothetical protein
VSSQRVHLSRDSHQAQHGASTLADNVGSRNARLLPMHANGTCPALDGVACGPRPRGGRVWHWTVGPPDAPPHDRVRRPNLAPDVPRALAGLGLVPHASGMAGDGYLNARQYRPRPTRGTQVLQNDLTGPVHAISPLNAADSGELRALCGAAVIISLPVNWPPQREQPRCATCRDLASARVPMPSRQADRLAHQLA